MPNKLAAPSNLMNNLQSSQFKQKNKRAIQVQRRTSRDSAKTASPHAILQRVTADPRMVTHDEILQLQRTIGNRATQELLKRGAPSVQKKMSPTTVQRKGWGSRAFDRMFGFEDYRRRSPQYQGNVPKKTKLTIVSDQNDARFDKMYARRRSEKSEVQAYYRRVGAQAQSVIMPKLNVKRIPIEDILNSPMAFNILKEYMDSEYVSEVGFFLGDILDKGVEFGGGKPNYTYTIKEVIRFYHDYIKDPSPWQNNVSFKTRRKLAAEIPALESKKGFTGFRKVTGKARDAMNDCVKEVVQVIRSDVYTRMAQSEWYPYAKLAADKDRKTREFDKANRVSNREFWLGF